MDEKPLLEGAQLPEPDVVTLRDGTVVRIRPIRPDDAPRLQAGFSRLSPESIFLRFLDFRKELPDAEAAALATVDYRTQMAFVACLDADPESIIGVARYAVSDPSQPHVAEAAIVVGDPFQNRGLGTILLGRLVAYARAQGIHTFTATVRHENERLLRFIQRSGFPVESRVAGPAREIRVELTGDGRRGTR